MSVNGFINTVTDGLIFYVDAANYKSYVSGSTSWYDLITYTNTGGTLVNGTTYYNQNSGVMFFDGIDDGVNFFNMGFTSSGARSVDIWVKSLGSDMCTLFGYGDIGTPLSSNLLHLNIVGQDTVYWGFNNADFYTYNTITNGSFNHISCTYNGDILDVSNVKMYINGYEVPLNQAGANLGDYPATTNSNYAAGYDNGFRYFNGQIPLIKFYNRALTPSEVLQNYNATKWRFQ